MSVRNIRRTAEYDGAVYYTVEDSYPAELTIDYLNRVMERKHWTPTADDPWNDPASSRKWSTSYEGFPLPRDHRWRGAWRNGRGDLVAYLLEFKVLRGDERDSRDLKIVGLHMTAERAEALRKVK